MLDASRVAKDAALAAGAVLKDRVKTVTGLRTKSSATDLVSDVDVAAGVAAVSAILDADPHARVIVEEPEVYEQLAIEPASIDDEMVWIVDPLDGTTSYLHSFPAYSVSVALVRSGRPVAGAVYDAARDQMHWAAAGHGAFIGSQQIRCTQTPALSEALLVTGFPYDRGAALDLQLAVLAAFLRAPIHGVRRDGSAALDCCHVAAGRTDGFWEYTLLPWDMAAGVIICTEAGAKVTDISGREWDSSATDIIAANPMLHSRMLEVIAEVAARMPQAKPLDAPPRA